MKPGDPGRAHDQDEPGNRQVRGNSPGQPGGATHQHKRIPDNSVYARESPDQLEGIGQTTRGKEHACNVKSMRRKELNVMRNASPSADQHVHSINKKCATWKHKHKFNKNRKAWQHDKKNS